jgi:WD40 repeat protein
LLPVDVRSWVDTSLAPGGSADYQVVGENLGGRGAPSATVAATRPRVDPSIGTIDAITVDTDAAAGPGSVYPGAIDAVTREVVAQTVPGGSDAVPEIRMLQGAGVSVMIPYLLPGPGVFPLTGWWVPSSVSQGHPTGCGSGSGSLTVREVEYDASLQLTTLSATYRLTCDVSMRPDLSGSLFVELRYKSTQGFAALTVGPPVPELDRIPVGTVSPAVPVKVTNTGLDDQALGTRSLAGDGADAWRIAEDTCPTILPAGSACTVRLEATPASSGRHPVQLVVPDETARGSHHAAADIVGTSLPSPATAVTALRLPSGGVDLSWSPAADWGGTGATGYVIHRTSDAGTARFDVPYSYAPTWSDISPPAHSTYAVSMVTEIGEGPPSAAATPKSVTDYFMTNASPGYRDPAHLGMIATPGGTTPVRLPTKAWAAGLTLSPDGRSLLSSQPVDGGYALWRQPVDGTSAPQRLWTASGARLDRPAWSSDGSRVAVGSTANSAAPDALHILRATGGAPTLSLPGLSEPAWLPDARTIVAHDLTGVTAALVKIDAGTGKRLGTIAGTEGARMPTVSPDGRWIAFKRYSATGTSSTFVIATAGGTARQAPDQVGFSDVDWSPDGSALAAVLNPPYGYSGIYRVPVSTTGTPGTATPISLRVLTLVHAIAWGGGRVAIAPSPALTGRQTTFTINTGALAPKATLTCSVDSGAASPCSNTFTTPTLTTGTHTLRVRSVEPGGRVTVAVRTFAVDATAPVAAIASMPATLLSSSATVRYSAAEKGGGSVASYDLRYRYATPAGTFTTYRQPSTWQAMRSTSLSLKLTQGYSYCFSARARDSVGNVSSWTAETCTRVALDDRALTGSDWTRRSSTSYAFGTYSTAATPGRMLAAKVGARQVGLLVTTCSTCGVVDVRLAGTKLGRKSLATSTTRHKQIIWLPSGAYRSGTLTITTVGIKRVYIDGVVIRK